MASHDRREEPSVAAQLFRDGHKFGFYQAVRLLEVLRPGSTPLGLGADPSQEPVRLRAAVSLAFPPSDIAEIRAAKGGSLPEMVLHFMSLAGAHGPLPHSITEHLLERVYRKDSAFADFLDLFHHRLLSLVYRVHRSHRVGIETGPLESHSFASYLYSLIGMGTAGLSGRMAIPDRALLRYAGLLSKTPRDTTGLSRLLADFFAIPVRCEPLVGAFRPLDASQCTSLGEGGQNRRLGLDTMLGGSVWDQQAGVRLVVGPLSSAQYQDFLPGRSRCVALCQLSRFYLGPQLDLKVSAMISGADRQPVMLSSRGGQGARLGWTSWLLPSSSGKEPIEVELFELPQFTDLPAAPPAEPPVEPPPPASKAAPPPATPKATPPEPAAAKVAAPPPATKPAPAVPATKAAAPSPATPKAASSLSEPAAAKAAAPPPATKPAPAVPAAKAAPAAPSAKPSSAAKAAPPAPAKAAPPAAKSADAVPAAVPASPASAKPTPAAASPPSGPPSARKPPAR